MKTITSPAFTGTVSALLLYMSLVALSHFTGVESVLHSTSLRLLGLVFLLLAGTDILMRHTGGSQKADLYSWSTFSLGAILAISIV